MERFEKLELTVETLRDLTDDQLREVAGGNMSGEPCNIQTTYYVPSYGGAWTMMCNTVETG
jgi:hypothetical protein